MHFPVMDVQIVNSIYFFESNNKTSVQKISVADNTGFSETFSTSSTDPPITKSVYGRFDFPFDSVDSVSYILIFTW